MNHNSIPKCYVDFVYQAPLFHGLFNPRVILLMFVLSFPEKQFNLCVLSLIIYIFVLQLFINSKVYAVFRNSITKGKDEKVKLLWSCFTCTCNSKSFCYKRDEGWGRTVTTWIWTIHHIRLNVHLVNFSFSGGQTFQILWLVVGDSESENDSS